MKKICQEWQLLLILVGILTVLSAQKAKSTSQKPQWDFIDPKKIITKVTTSTAP